MLPTPSSHRPVDPTSETPSTSAVPDDLPRAPAVSVRAEALLASVAGGDDRAFSMLYEAYAARLYGLVLRVLRDRAQAEEVTQEVFLEIWRTATRFDPARGGGLGWMLTIAHRKAVDRVRSAEASSRRETRHHELTVELASDVTAEAAHTSLEAERVRSSLSSLSSVQRRAIELAYFGGHTHAEVAQILGIPLGTAKTRIRAALIHLRDSLDPAFA